MKRFIPIPISITSRVGEVDVDVDYKKITR